MDAPNLCMSASLPLQEKINLDTSKYKKILQLTSALEQYEYYMLG